MYIHTILCTLTALSYHFPFKAHYLHFKIEDAYFFKILFNKMLINNKNLETSYAMDKPTLIM